VTDNPFQQPGSGDKFDLKNYGEQWVGALVLVYPKKLIENFDTGKYDPSDVVDADIILVDRYGEDGQPLVFRNSRLFSRGLVNNTRDRLGQTVLGRLGKKQFANGVGWYLDEFTDEDAAKAGPIHQAYQSGQFSAPSPSTPPTSAASPPPATGGQSGWGQLPPPAQSSAPPAAPAGGVDPDLLAFLAGKGVDVTKIKDNDTAKMLAAAYG
jgi:hypothetical protein